VKARAGLHRARYGDRRRVHTIPCARALLGKAGVRISIGPSRPSLALSPTSRRPPRRSGRACRPVPALPGLALLIGHGASPINGIRASDVGVVGFLFASGRHGDGSFVRAGTDMLRRDGSLAPAPYGLRLPATLRGGSSLLGRWRASIAACALVRAPCARSVRVGYSSPRRTPAWSARVGCSARVASPFGDVAAIPRTR
jgi:hypothetical protein